MLLKDPETLDYFDLQKKYKPEYLTAKEITDSVYQTSALHIRTLAMDFPSGTTLKYRKVLEAKWIEVLPELNQVKALWVRHLAGDNFLEAVCKMKNLEWLRFEISAIQNLSAIANLKKLKKLELRSAKLKDVSPLLALKNLEALAIDASYNIQNYEIIGQMVQLKGLRLAGDRFAPKNLKLRTLNPFVSLKLLEHLDLERTVVEDKSYDMVLQLNKLVRMDGIWGITKQMAETIKNSHKTLKEGSLMTWDFGGKNYVIVGP